MQWLAQFPILYLPELDHTKTSLMSRKILHYQKLKNVPQKKSPFSFELSTILHQNVNTNVVIVCTIMLLMSNCLSFSPFQSLSLFQHILTLFLLPKSLPIFVSNSDSLLSRNLLSFLPNQDQMAIRSN